MRIHRQKRIGASAVWIGAFVEDFRRRQNPVPDLEIVGYVVALIRRPARHLEIVCAYRPRFSGARDALRYSIKIKGRSRAAIVGNQQVNPLEAQIAAVDHVGVCAVPERKPMLPAVQPVIEHPRIAGAGELPEDAARTARPDQIPQSKRYRDRLPEVNSREINVTPVGLGELRPDSQPARNPRLSGRQEGIKRPLLAVSDRVEYARARPLVEQTPQLKPPGPPVRRIEPRMALKSRLPVGRVPEYRHSYAPTRLWL